MIEPCEKDEMQCAQRNVIKELIERGDQNAQDIQILYDKHKAQQLHVSEVWRGLRDQVDSVADSIQRFDTLKEEIDDIKRKVVQLVSENASFLSTVRGSEKLVYELSDRLDRMHKSISVIRELVEDGTLERAAELKKQEKERLDFAEDHTPRVVAHNEADMQFMTWVKRIAAALLIMAALAALLAAAITGGNAILEVLDLPGMSAWFAE